MLKARDVLAMSINDVWELPDGPMKLEFEDGVVDTNTRETIFSRYIWEFHRKYPHTPLKKCHHIAGQRLGSSTHLRLIANALWDSYDSSPVPISHDGMEERSQLAYIVTNMLFNDMSRRLEDWVSGISYIDFLEIVNDPIIEEINRLVRPNEDGSGITIEAAYAKIAARLKDPANFQGNGVAKAARSGMVSLGQILQCVGPRGYVTDIDSTIFRNPILTGFTHGILSLEDSLKESRSAAKALFYAKDQMARSEYFNRNIQLSAATLCNMHMEDCGTTTTVPFPVMAGDLRDLQGMWHFDDKEQKLKAIRLGDKHLIGKTINLRTVFNCVHPDVYGVCVKCFGELGLSFPRGTNIGHHCSSALQSKVGQRILSTKHEDGNASVENIIFNPLESQIVRIGAEPSKIYLNPALKGKKLYLSIAEKEAPNLHDLTFVENTNILVPGRYSELRRVKFTLEDNKGITDHILVQMYIGTRYGFISQDLLNYIKKAGWTMDEVGNYVIDLTEFNQNEPLFNIPKKHYSTVDHMQAIEAMIKGKARNGVPSIIDYETPGQALIALHDLVASKLTVSISHLQTIILSTMVQDRDARDFNLPVDRLNAKPETYRSLMGLRSLGPTMAFEGQVGALYSPSSFVVKNRPRHPLDALLMG